MALLRDRSHDLILFFPFFFFDVQDMGKAYPGTGNLELI